MKKYLLKLACVAVLLILLLSFSGCGSDQKTFVGEWVATVDVTELTAKEMEQEEDLKDFFKFDDLTVNLIYTFNSDGTYSSKIDKESVERYCDDLVDILTLGMEAYLKDLCNTMGIDITDTDTLNGILTAMGADSIAQLAELSIDREEFSEIFEGIEEKGLYKASNGRLYTYEENTVPDTDIYEEYEIVNVDEIKFVSSTETDGSDLYPFTLKRK